jgi:hypothetical protein
VPRTPRRTGADRGGQLPGEGEGVTQGEHSAKAAAGCSRGTPNTRSFTGRPLGRMRDADYLFCRTTVCLYLLMLPGGLRGAPREPRCVEHHLLGRAQVRCAWVSSRGWAVPRSGP